jgi:hypothetical protein
MGYRTVTQQKSFKRRVRARMAKTGERYTAARAVVERRTTPPGRQAPESVEASAAASPPPDQPANAPGFRYPVSEEAVARATGHAWAHWFAVLDAWGAVDRRHPEIARWLSTEHGVPGWWTQSITVAYEQARGMRAPGQHADGFSASATRTLGVPAERVFEAFVDETLRARWLPDVALRLRTATPHRTARFDWGDGSERVVVGFSAKDDGRSVVAVDHQRVADAATAAARKTFWRERLGALRELLEG